MPTGVRETVSMTRLTTTAVAASQTGLSLEAARVPGGSNNRPATRVTSSEAVAFLAFGLGLAPPDCTGARA